MRHRLVLFVVLAALVAAGCACGEVKRKGAPGPADTGDPCIISLDCGDGTHCDLGECWQACSTEHPCPDGLECTVRGRCVEPGEPEMDPIALPIMVGLSVDPGAIDLVPEQESFSFQVEVPGTTRYRLAPSADWLQIPELRGEMSGFLEVTVTVDVANAPTDGAAAYVGVFTELGNGQIQVTPPPVPGGVFRGAIHFTTLQTDDDGVPVDVPIDLGSTQITVELREDTGAVEARVVPEKSLLWPSSGGAEATGTGSLSEDDHLSLQLTYLVSTGALRTLLSESPSTLGDVAVGRELALEMAYEGAGAIRGTATETIHGLSSTPITVRGEAHLARVPGEVVSDFVVGDPPEMPPNVEPDPGDPPEGCDCLGGTDEERWGCVIDSMTTGFPLHTFYLDTETGFELVDPGDGRTPYEVAVESCTDDVGADPRADVVPADGSCANTPAIQCARWLAATEFAEHNALRMQGAHDAARAWAELFLLVGNEAMVEAGLAAFDASPALAMREALAEARVAYDAGLTRILNPVLLEELRALGPLEALEGPFAPDRPNDRAAVRRLADLVAGTVRATKDIVELDSSGRDLEGLRERVKDDALLVWLATVVLADLDARWRGDEPLTAEVRALGGSVTSLDRRIAALEPGYTPLGIPRSYVPMLARTDPSETRTNFERLHEIAQTTVDRAFSAEEDARAAQREFDTRSDRVEQALIDAQDTFLSEVVALCGNDFVGADEELDPDLLNCGRTAGEMRDLLLGAETARLDMLLASQAIEDLARRVEIKTNTMMRVQQLRREQIAFMEETGEEIYALDYAKAAVDGVKAGLEAGGGCGPLTPGACGVAAAVGALEFASGAITAEREKLVRMQEMQAVETDMNIEYERDMAEIKETLLEQQGLRIQEAIATNEYARALSSIATAREQLQNLMADYEAARANATRPYLNDPSFRILRDQMALRARSAFRRAKVELFLAARALEYETNVPLPAIADAILAAQNAIELDTLLGCVSGAWNDWLRVVSSTNEYTTEISVRADILAIDGPREDEATGESVSEGDQFRRYLFARPFVRGNDVWPAIRFGTTLRPDEGLFSSLVCNDRIQTLEMQLVGENLGDEEAEVQILAGGGSLLRACDAPRGEERINEWGLRPDGDPAPALVQAGVNEWGGASPNRSLLGFSVAQTEWIVTIPDGGASPANRDLDVLNVDDIIIRMVHTATAAGGATGEFNPTCD